MWSSIVVSFGGCSNAFCAEIGLQVPRRAVSERPLAEPAEARRRDLGEAPAHRHALTGGARLHDGLAARAAELPRVVLLHGIVPEDVPGVEHGVVDSQGRAVERARQNPD